MHHPSGALLFLPFAAALAGAPFGGDDSGFVPPSRSIARCEAQVAGSVASFARCVLSCNVRAAKAAFKGRPIHLPACAQTGRRSCRERYDRAGARIAQTGRCPACLSPPTPGLLADRAAARLAQIEGAIHCRAAPDVAALACENDVARNLARTIVCIADCHAAAASAGRKDHPFDEEGCERSCRSAYDQTSTGLAPHCPPCLGGAQQAALAGQVETAADEENGDVFCAGVSATTTTTSTTVAVSTTSTGVATSTTSIVPTTSTTSTTLVCTGDGAPCGPTLDGCTARMVCVDGALVCRGTFVAPSPLGDAANPGTEAAPLSSIAAGIENGALLGAGAVCACAGSYFENLTIVEGISLRGGYDCTTWARDPTTNFTAVTGLPPDGVKVPPGVTAATSLDGLLIAGAAFLDNVAAALTVTDASPTLKDLTVTNRAVGPPLMSPTLYALHIRQTGVSPASPTIDGGEYRAAAPADGTGIGIFIEGASPSLTHVVAYGADLNAFPNPATAVGIRCVGCAGTTISQSGIVGGPATAMSVGLWASGDVSGLAADQAFFWGGSTSFSAVLSYGTLLDDCTGTSTWSSFSAGYFYQLPAPTTGIGFAASGAGCAPSLTASQLLGCHDCDESTALECDGAPCTVTDSMLNATFDAPVSARTPHGARCLDGGCARLARNTITTGVVLDYHLALGEGIGVDIEGASPAVDANVIDGPLCSTSAISGSSTHSTLRLRDSASIVTNNLLRGSSCDDASEVVRFEKGSGPEVPSPTIENNTLVYGGGTHTGLFVDSTGPVPPAGYVRNNIIQNTGAGPPSFAIYEADTSSDLAALENNDLDDQTGVLYFVEGTTALTLAQVNALPGAAANISADPLLDATGHIAAGSPCRNAGTATGAPATDIDGQPRPQEGAVDIGADEFVP